MLSSTKVGKDKSQNLKILNYMCKGSKVKDQRWTLDIYFGLPDTGLVTGALSVTAAFWFAHFFQLIVFRHQHVDFVLKILSG